MPDFDDIARRVWFLPAAGPAGEDTPELTAARAMMLRDGCAKTQWEPKEPDRPIDGTDH